MRIANQTIHVVDNDFDPVTLVRNMIESDEEDGEAFVVTDLTDVWKKHEAWKKLFPGVKPFYAVKCNHQRPILEVLAALGTGFDCLSLEEMKMVLDVGVHPSRIMFSNSTKMIQHINYAARHGVDLMAFDSKQELEKIKMHHPTAKLVLKLRLGAEDSSTTRPSKFGCEPHEVDSLLASGSKLRLNIVGVSFHLGKSSWTPEAYRSAVRSSAEVVRKAVQYGYKLKLIDIGGGFPAENGADINKIADAINDSLKREFPDGDIVVISEPGGFFVASASIEAVAVIGVKSKDKPAYYLNDGVYGSFHFLINKGGNRGLSLPRALSCGCPGSELPSVLWGPTCDGADMIADGCPLPLLNIGDWLLFTDMGAYTSITTTNFNGFLPLYPTT